MTQLTEPQSEWLETEALRVGLSVAELLRRIVDEHRGELPAKRVIK